MPFSSPENADGSAFTPSTTSEKSPALAEPPLSLTTSVTTFNWPRSAVRSTMFVDSLALLFSPFGSAALDETVTAAETSPVFVPYT